MSGRADGVGDGERRQRPRKSNHTFAANGTSGSRESPRPHLDALDPRLLTPSVWQELFDIFQIHYSADLPFLHPPTFLKPLHQANLQASSTESNTAARPPASPEFLLAFLALTARFHPKLVAHHCPPTSTRASNPLIASEYYAEAASARLSGSWNDNRTPDIERTQAGLMLGLHEWGMCRGARAWLTIGYAIRSAQAMGLQYELDLDDEPLSRSLALNCEAERLGVNARRNLSFGMKDEGDAFIQQEVRRRTFWSCYIMDRYLSSGKYRPQMLHAKELRIQLPASERSFLFAEKVRTLMLGEEEDGVARRAEVQSHRQASVLLGTTGTPEPKMAPSPKSIALHEAEDDRERLETGPDEGLVSRYIKILEIYGRIVKWSCAGGRRVEQHPPWDERCEFYQLRKQCLDFKAGLPRQHTLTPQNTQAHISLKTSTPYTLVHTVYSLCQIVLHREYVPFIPIRCKKPEGPLDPPLFPSDKYDIPPCFWEDSARECFKAAREIMDLVRSCQEWNALVETPIVGFAIYTVAFDGVYCINFPQMDPNGYMCTPRSSDAHQKLESSKPGESKGFEAARKALEMLGQMRPKLHMADGWFKTINRMHKYFRRMKSDYKKNMSALESNASESSDSPVSSRHLSLREGGVGGGLDEFKLLERTLKDFGNLEDQDLEMLDVGQRPNSRALDAVYDDHSISGTTVKSEEPDHRSVAVEPPRSENGPWNAINAGPGIGASQNGTVSTSGSAQFRSYDSYQQPHHQSQAPPPQQPSYAHQINNFRPVYSNETPGAPGALPSVMSPTSYSATTPSQASPPFDRQYQHYNTWTPQNAAYPMQQLQPAYTNGISHQQHQLTPIQTAGAYATPSQQPPQHLQASAPMQEHHQPWNQMEKEAWLNNLDTRLGGDDIAAFVDGGELAEWATNMAAQRGYGGGWLTTVWSGGADEGG